MVTTLESPKEAATGLRPLVGESPAFLARLEVIDCRLRQTISRIGTSTPWTGLQPSRSSRRITRQFVSLP